MEIINSLRENSGRVLVVAAHSADEVIGTGGLLTQLHQAQVVHVTDGAPRALAEAAVHGFASREAYARARHAEAVAALHLAGIARGNLHGLGFPDRETSFNLVQLVWSMVELFSELRPLWVLTHPYEGGHPDHDSTIFAVQAACSLAGKSGDRVPEVLEFVSDHGAGPHLPSRLVPLEFHLALSGEERLLKKRMFDCFVTQRRALRSFPLEFERYRWAPRYDFSKPPHEGSLYYENFNWGIAGERWRANARRAIQALGLQLLPRVA